MKMRKRFFLLTVWITLILASPSLAIFMGRTPLVGPTYVTPQIDTDQTCGIIDVTATMLIDKIIVYNPMFKKNDVVVVTPYSGVKSFLWYTAAHDGSFEVWVKEFVHTESGTGISSVNNVKFGYLVVGVD